MNTKKTPIAAAAIVAGLMSFASAASANCSTANLAGIWDVALINTTNDNNYWCALTINSAGIVAAQSCEVGSPNLLGITLTQSSGCKIRASVGTIWGATDSIPSTSSAKPKLISLIYQGVGWYHGHRR